MQSISIPIPGQQRKPGTIKSPERPDLGPEGSTSPRRGAAQLSSRSPNAHPLLGGTLRMGSFYEIDTSFGRLREALKPDSKAARTNMLPAVLDELQNAIKTSTLDAERAFTRRSFAACTVHLDAAKANQVVMLGKVDDIADAAMSDKKRTEIRCACMELGTALTKLLIQAKTMANESAQEKMRKQKALVSDSDSDSEAKPPSSPPPAAPTPESHGNSPARTAQKRTQGDADSPVLAQSPSKRQKIDISTSASNSTTSTTTTTTTTPAAAPQSAPTYGPAPQLHLEHEASGATSSEPASRPNKQATASSTTKSSPQKMRTLSPQARPRPRSQLFVAPPDFTSQAREASASVMPTAAPVQALPGAVPRNAVEGAQADAVKAGQRS